MLPGVWFPQKLKRSVSMKKSLRALLCTAVLALSLCLPAFAAQSSISGTPVTLPEKQGDFYLMVNGEFVTSFTDALPQAKDNRSFLPFRHTFEILGFDHIEWHQETSTAVASQGSLSVSVKLGEKAFTITENGQTRRVETDTAAYADTKIGRTFIPVGLIARALDNFNVGWDAENGVAILDNVDQLLAQCSESFSLMDRVIAYVAQFGKGAWSQTGDSNLDLSLRSGSSSPLSVDITLSAKGPYTALTALNSGFQLDSTSKVSSHISIGGHDLTSGLSQIPGLPTISVPTDLDLAMRGNLSTGTFYFYSPGLQQVMATVSGNPVKDAWYRIDMDTIADQLGSDVNLSFSDLLAMARTDVPFRQQLPQILHSLPVTSMYATTSDYLKILCATAGDSAFEKQGSDYVNDMTDQLNGAGSSQIILYSSEDKITGIGVTSDLKTTQEGKGDITLRMDLAQKDQGMDITLELAVDGQDGSQTPDLSLSLDLGGTLSPSRDTPASEPPAGAEVVDLADSGLFGSDGTTGTFPSI